MVILQQSPAEQGSFPDQHSIDVCTNNYHVRQHSHSAFLCGNKCICSQQCPFASLRFTNIEIEI